jgi:hypothetical protein
MKPCQTAALALFAWWLMVPICRDGRGQEYCADLAQSKWSWAGNYRSQAACETDRARYLALEKKLAKLEVISNPLTVTGLLHLEYTNGICAAADDPRFPQIKSF